MTLLFALALGAHAHDVRIEVNANNHQLAEMVAVPQDGEVSVVRPNPFKRGPPLGMRAEVERATQDDGELAYTVRVYATIKRADEVLLAQPTIVVPADQLGEFQAPFEDGYLRIMLAPERPADIP